MNYYLKVMENNLTDEDKGFLKSIYEPQVVAVPPSDACRSMCVTPDGEIRIYGAINKKEPEDIGTPVYISSKDCGLSWKTHLAKESAIGCATLNPKTGRYISTYPNEYKPELKKIINKSGTWAIINDEGIDSTNNRYVRLSEKFVHILKNPLYLDSCERWFILGEYHHPDHSDTNVVLFYSDDDGESWTEVVLKSAPKFEVKPPHKSSRWQQYSCEPTIAELSNGELVMIVRTSQDYHYMYRSKDKGETWSEPEPSCFHGTITMPVLEKLTDGRIVFFWCNTQPMPELDHSNTLPPISEDETNGVWEDVFTNRDANHLAISEDDMSTWIGFRELFLNSIRNNADFRTIGGVNSRDKSVHQAQILELPYNKLLIDFGQNVSARKVIILDIDWLYEKSRFENFKYGLGNISTQVYLKSNLGCYRGFAGHCAYNRTNGAMLVPDPSGDFTEALLLCNTDDCRLISNTQGAVWNFPAAKKGRVTVKLKVIGEGLRVSLLDHWMNPIDRTVDLYSAATFDIYNTDTPNNGYTELTVEFDCANSVVSYSVNGKSKDIPFKNNMPNGICYLHLQTLSEKGDSEGTLIKTLDMISLD